MFESFSKARAVIAGLTMLAAVSALPGAASAQGIIDFLWGGEPEYGGKRQAVSFSQKYPAGQIIVSFGDRRLYLITKPGTAISYPIAVPREQSRWEGNTVVSSKRENPAWTPTPDMIKENPRLPSWVPGGHPMNPLGVRALYLGESTYRIHGTDAPWTIGQAVSKGCIRMFNEDVLDLYPRVPVGTKVIVTWNKFETGPGAEIASSAPQSSSAPYGAKPKAKGWSKSDDEDDAAAQPARPYDDADTADASRTDEKAKTASNGGKTRPKEGFFIYPDDDVKPEDGMVTKFGRKVGAGAVSKSAQTAQAN